jgi:hypothetical protein
MAEYFDNKAIRQRFNRMKMEFYKWRPALREIRDYIAPTHGFFEYEMPDWGKRIDHEKIVNGHAMRALNTLASGMTSGMTSSSRPWFALGTPDPYLSEFQPVKEWLAQTQRILMTVFSKSNFYQVVHNLYSEIGAFGTAAMMIMPDYKTVIRARGFTAGEYYIGQDNDNRVDSFGRQYWSTVGQIVKEFGLENCSPAVQSMYKNSQVDQYRLIRHLIEPNDSRIEGVADFRGKAWRSVQWEDAGRIDKQLRLSGFEEFPIMAPRWQTRASSCVYGRGPGWEALGDVKMLQKMEKDALIALDKVVDPPVQVMGEIDHVNLFPGGITKSSVVAPNAGVRAAYQVSPDFNAIGAWSDKVMRRIDKSFYADLFMLISNDDRSDITAREIVERHEEKLQALGPVLEGLESELLNPAIDRTFNIALRAGLIPEPPMELQGMDLKVEYISVLAQAQKMVGITAIEQTFRFAGSLAGVAPDVMDVINTDEGIRKYADAVGGPPEIVRDEKKVLAIRQERAKQVQAEKTAQAMERTVAGAQTLANTPVGQNSALDVLMKGAPGGTGQ